MGSMNQVTLMGNLTRDPELRHTPQGTAVCDFCIAINDGKDKVYFAECVAWDKQAEALSEHCGKGMCIVVQGNLASDEWTDKETGQKRRKTRVIARRFQFAERKKDAPAPAHIKKAAEPTPQEGFDEIPF